jgi:putative membrane protein
MMKVQRIAVLVCLLGTLAAPLALAQAIKGDDAGSVDPATFVKKASHINLGEIELGTLATKRSARADVKEYGQRLVTDHQKAYDDLKKVAVAENLQVSTTIDKQHKDLAARLGSLQGANFDREFLPAMVKGHKEAIQLFEAQAASGRDIGLKSYAQKCLPVLRDHLKMAEELQTAKASK